MLKIDKQIRRIKMRKSKKSSKKEQASLIKLAIQLAVVLGVSIAITFAASQARADVPDAAVTSTSRPPVSTNGSPGQVWTADAPQGSTVYNPDSQEHATAGHALKTSITIIGCGIKMPEWYHGNCGNPNGRGV